MVNYSQVQKKNYHVLNRKLKRFIEEQNKYPKFQMLRL